VAMLGKGDLHPSAKTMVRPTSAGSRKIPSFTQCCLSMKAVPLAPVSNKMKRESPDEFPQPRGSQLTTRKARIHNDSSNRYKI
jgi:hypothetical protein